MVRPHGAGLYWMVVDGCRKQGDSWYAQRALAHYRARPELIVLTHPHRDHAGGVADLVEDQTSGPTSGWPTLAMLPPPDLGPAPGPAFTPAAYTKGAAEHAIAAIADRWSRHPLCRWDLPLGSTHPLGPAKITVISPVPGRRPTALRLDPNHHTLFDLGYVTVPPDYVVRVSPALNEDWQNGKRYYPYDGRRLAAVPTDERLRPSASVLAWHNEQVFRRAG